MWCEGVGEEQVGGKLVSWGDEERDGVVESGCGAVDETIILGVKVSILVIESLWGKTKIVRLKMIDNEGLEAKEGWGHYAQHNRFVRV